MSELRLAIDVGGTFTDLVIVDANTGQLLAEAKAPSTPPGYVDGVIEAIRVASRRLGTTSEELLRSTVSFAHGSTVATNTILERRGACVGLLCTKGFRDTIAIRRGRHLGGTWDIGWPRTPPLIPRERRIGIGERVNASGIVLQRPVQEEIWAAVSTFAATGVDSIAICFLHAYVNPSNELEAAALVRELLPKAHISVSSSIVPLMGEYERLSTAVLDAYVGPRMRTYLADLAESLSSAGLHSRRFLMAQSNGGLTDVESCRERPVVTLLSGPSAGAAGAALVSRHIDDRNLIVLDMGGTTTDITIIRKGLVSRRDYSTIADHECAIPSVEVEAIGTGGGTVAYVDRAGILRVGPESAGAVPGPACYGMGGTEPTLTDANVVLGRLMPKAFRGGDQPLDVAAARRAIGLIASRLGLDELTAAAGIVQLADESVATAIRLVTVERGFDPRSFTLLAAGGAAGLQVGAIARLVGIPKVCVPRQAPVFCALGLLEATVERDFFASVTQAAATVTDGSLGSVHDELLERARADLKRMTFDTRGASFALIAAMRYPGHLSTVPVPVLDPQAVGVADVLQGLFHERHELLFGYSRPEIPVEIAYFKMTARLPPEHIVLPQRPQHPGTGSQPEWRAANLLVDGEFQGVQTIPGSSIEPNAAITGPALVYDDATTVLVRRDQTVTMDPVGNLLILDGARISARGTRPYRPTDA